MSDDFLFDDKCSLWSPEGNFGKCPPFSSIPLEMLPVVKWNSVDVGWYSMHRYWMNPVRYIDNEEPLSSNTNLKEYLITRLTNGDVSRFKSFTPPINPSSGKPYKSGNVYEQALKDFIVDGCRVMEEEDFNIAKILLTCMDRLGLRDELVDCAPRLRIGTTLNKSVDCSAMIDLYSVDKGCYQLKLTSNQLFSYVGDSYRWKLIQNGNLLEAALITKIFYATTSLVPPVSFIVVQTKPPYQIKMYRVKQSTVDYYWDIVDSCLDYFLDIDNEDTLMRVEEI